MILCDSCGRPANPQHIRERIERLELATRFRPVHIRALLIDAAPPALPQDYFYRAASDRAADPPGRSDVSRAYFDRLVNCAGSLRNSGLANEEEAELAEFQRQGLFLTYVVECPLEDSADLSSALKQAVPNLLKRVQLSYKPKFIALLSGHLGELAPVLQSAWSDRLILDGASPFVGRDTENTESAGGSAGQSLNLSDRLAEAIGRLP